MRTSPPRRLLASSPPRTSSISRLPSARKSSLSVKTTKAAPKISTQPSEHLEPLAERQPAHQQGADDQHEAAQKINEIKRPGRRRSQLDLHPVIARLDPVGQLGAAGCDNPCCCPYGSGSRASAPACLIHSSVMARCGWVGCGLRRSASTTHRSSPSNSVGHVVGQRVEIGRISRSRRRPRRSAGRRW